MSWTRTTAGHSCNVMQERAGKFVECGKPATHVAHYDDQAPDDETDVFACPHCLRENMRADAQRDQEAAFTLEHGYPPYATTAWCKATIQRVAKRLQRLRELGDVVPATIWNLELAMLKKRVGFMRTYLKAGSPNG